MTSPGSSWARRHAGQALGAGEPGGWGGAGPALHRWNAGTASAWHTAAGGAANPPDAGRPKRSQGSQAGSAPAVRHRAGTFHQQDASDPPNEQGAH